MKTKAWLIWLVSNLVVIFSNMQVVYTFISVNLEKELALTITQIALANSVYAWSFAVLQFFSGSIFNIFSSRKIYLFSVSTIIAGFLLLINANNFFHLILSQVLISVGASFGFVGAAHISSVCFPITQFGLMFSLVQTISSLSALVIQILFADLLAGDAYWKNLIMYVILLGAVILILTFFCPSTLSERSSEKHTRLFSKLAYERQVQEAHGAENRSVLDIHEDLSTGATTQLPAEVEFRKKSTVKNSIKTVISSMLTVLKLKDIWTTSMVGAITFGTFLALNTLWAPRLLNNAGLDKIQLGIATAILWLGLAVGAPIADQISNLFKNRKYVISAFAVLQSVSIIVLLCNHLTVNVIYFCMLMFGFAAGGHMLNFTVGSDIVKREYISTSSSIINGFMFIGSGIIVSILTLFTDYQMALFAIFVMLITASVLNCATKETYPKKNTVVEP